MIRSFHAKVAEHTEFVTVVELRGERDNQQKLNGASFNRGRSIWSQTKTKKKWLQRQTQRGKQRNY